MSYSSNLIELGETKWRTKLDEDWNSLAKLKYKDIITKQNKKLNKNY